MGNSDDGTLSEFLTDRLLNNLISSVHVDEGTTHIVYDAVKIRVSIQLRPVLG